MQINWFTVIAQIINFLILVWLLKRFLYKPVLNAIDERESKIALQLKDAENKEIKAKKEQSKFAEKNEQFDNEKKGMMDKAISETNDERLKLLEEARNEATELRSKLEKALKESQKTQFNEIKDKTQHEVFEIAKKTFAYLASQNIEEQIGNIFIKHLKNLDKDEKKQFVESFTSGSSSILVQSAFGLPVKQQSEIESAVNEILEGKTSFKFKTTPDLIGGIELTSNGYKLAWSISAYINSLQKSVSEPEMEEPEATQKKISRK